MLSSHEHDDVKSLCLGAFAPTRDQLSYFSNQLLGNLHPDQTDAISRTSSSIEYWLILPRVIILRDGPGALIIPSRGIDVWILRLPDSSSFLTHRRLRFRRPNAAFAFPVKSYA